VALGDSYASGPGIPVQRVDPVGCQRSTHNYPARLAAALGISDYTDVSCGGARSEDMTAAQPVPQGPNPPQFAALTPDTDLVTITSAATTSTSGISGQAALNWAPPTR
jgi:hypothetical protein